MLESPKANTQKIDKVEVVIPTPPSPSENTPSSQADFPLMVIRCPSPKLRVRLLFFVDRTFVSASCNQQAAFHFEEWPSLELILAGISTRTSHSDGSHLESARQLNENHGHHNETSMLLADMVICEGPRVDTAANLACCVFYSFSAGVYGGVVVR